MVAYVYCILYMCMYTHTYIHTVHKRKSNTTKLNILSVFQAATLLQGLKNKQIFTIIGHGDNRESGKCFAEMFTNTTEPQ